MKRKANNEYGELVSIADTTVRMKGEVDETEDGSNVVNTGSSEVGNVLWEYQKLGRIYGIPVNKEHVGLGITSEDMLFMMFKLSAKPGLLLLSMSPEDAESKKKYDSLLERVYDGSVRILEESRQFDATSCRFIVWIKYEELQYDLHPRYKYMAEEFTNDR